MKDWPQEVRRDHVYANFKPSKTERLKAKRNHDPRADRPGNDPKHLDALRKCPCCVPHCNKVGSNDPHHLKAGTNERGVGLRSSDRWAVPLCRAHHDEVESIGSRNETRWFSERGIVAIDLAAALWGSRGDAAVMTKIILAHRGMK